MSGVVSAEASALHAILDGDRDGAERILRGFLDGELRALEGACDELGGLVAAILRAPMRGIEDQEDEPDVEEIDVPDVGPHTGAIIREWL